MGDVLDGAEVVEDDGAERKKDRQGVLTKAKETWRSISSMNISMDDVNCRFLKWRIIF